jgi:DNA-binding SARP family transcriptional activator/tetratricopeptide (TPR) repeat protein
MDRPSEVGAVGRSRIGFRLLGPVEVLRDGRPDGPTTAQLRCVLALLLLDLGRVVTADRLIAALWPAGPPVSALNTVRVYVTRLRRLISGDPAVAVSTVGQGWRLDCDPDRVDLFRFRDLVARARRCGPGAAGLLNEALALWTGPALADVSGDEWRESLRAGLEEERLTALEDRIALDIDAGAARDVVPELSALVGDHPVRERPVQLLIAALGASGRTGEALELYRRTRRRLVDELGVEPGPALQHEHRRLLERSQGEAASFDRPVPRQLPADLVGFTGREQALARLGAAAGNPVAVITGLPGSGKTTLAVHWAHRAADRYPDGHLWADLRGFDPAGRALDPGEALGAFLEALGVPPSQVPVRTEARAALYRSLLADRRMLVVLDNARDEEQVRPLLPGAAACCVLVTARSRLPGLTARHGARQIALDVLERDEARDLLAGRIGAHRTDADRKAVRRIIDRCARLPLAIAVVAARAVDVPDFPLTALADELDAQAAPLDGFASPDAGLDLRSAFGCSYRALSPATARTFRLIGLHWGPDFTTEAVAALTGEAPAVAREALTELVRMGLAVEFRPGRFRLHDLLAAYAAELTEAEDAAAARRDASERLLDELLRCAEAASAVLTPFPVPGEAGGFSVDAQRHDRASEWFESERPVLLGAVEAAYAQHFDAHAWRLARSLETYLRLRNAAAERSRVHQIAVRAAQRAASVEGMASAHLGLGIVQSHYGDKAESRANLKLALDHFSAAGDGNGEADTRLVLCVLDAGAGDYASTLAHATLGLELYRRTGNTAGQVRALNNIGFCHAQLGDLRQARENCLAALDLAVAIRDKLGEANVLDSLGAIESQLGAHARATDHFRRAVAIATHLGERKFTASALTNLGESHVAAGDPEAARAAWKQALSILDELGHPDTAALRDRLGDLGGRR